MEGYSNEEVNMNRLRSIDRALMASRLVQPEFFERTEEAIIGTEKNPGPIPEKFRKVCADAQITDQELIDHILEIIVAARKVYLGHAPGVIW
jgi:hypothetical protein